MWEATGMNSMALMGVYWPIIPRCVEDIAETKTAEAPSLDTRTTATITMQLLMIAFLGQDEC